MWMFWMCLRLKAGSVVGFWIRGSAELAGAVWQSHLYSPAVPPELPQRVEPSQRGDKYVCRFFLMLLVWIRSEYPKVSLCFFQATTFWWPVLLRWQLSTGETFVKLLHLRRRRAVFLFVSFPLQRCPGIGVVSLYVPLRERSVGRSAVCSRHRPGFWWAEGSTVGNVWTGQSSPQCLHSSLRSIFLPVQHLCFKWFVRCDQTVMIQWGWSPALPVVYAGTSVLQIPSSRQRIRRAVRAAVEAELQESCAVNHLFRPDWRWLEGAGCPHTEGPAHLTGRRTLIHEALLLP